MDYSRFLRILVLVSIVLLLLMPCVSAHRVYVQEQIKEVEIKAWFGGGDPMANADVSIYTIKDGKEELYIEDRADSDGLYYFAPRPGVSEYRVVVSESGHKSEKTFNLAGGSVTETEAQLPLSASIIAGFGYIIGIAGMALYFSSRKSKGQ